MLKLWRRLTFAEIGLIAGPSKFSGGFPPNAVPIIYKFYRSVLIKSAKQEKKKRTVLCSLSEKRRISDMIGPDKPLLYFIQLLICWYVLVRLLDAYVICRDACVRLQRTRGNNNRSSDRIMYEGNERRMKSTEIGW